MLRAHGPEESQLESRLVCIIVSRVVCVKIFINER